MKTNRPAPDPGEPYLTCFDCQRALSIGQLTLFPWWDEQVHEFDVMYRCERCLPKAHRQVQKQLAEDEDMLSRFVDFARKRVVSRPSVAPHEALEYARQVLDQLAAHEAFVQKR